VVATQSMVEVSYGPLGLEGIRQGKSPQSVLSTLLAKDEGWDLRQVAMVDANGNVAVHTGSRCIAEAGHQTGDQFSVQANMMLRNTVWPSMAGAFSSCEGELTERLLAALDAAQAEGGDIRGKQSAAMLVVDGKRHPHPWQGVIVDLRVDDHPEPLRELRRLIKVNQAYQLMNAGDGFLSGGKIEEAFNAYDQAVDLAPEYIELPFWKAVTLVESGKMAEAIPIFQHIFSKNRQWLELLKRLPRSGLLKASDEDKRSLFDL